MKPTSTAILVPARLASARFPEKLLHRIAGRELILHVADRIAGEAPEYPLFFAVDDTKLSEVLERNGHRWVMTSPEHPTGTDRLAEANRRIQAELVVNVQADEPLVTGRQIRALAELIRGDCDMATLATPIRRPADFANPNQVKVVLNNRGEALYFSRAPIPYPRDNYDRLEGQWFDQARVLRHLGLYAYKASFLEKFTRMEPGRLEMIEKLEQLRALENGCRIAVGLTDEPTIGIDTRADAEAFERLLTR